MASGTSVVADDDQHAELEFTLTVLPLLKEKCLGCHGGDPRDVKGEYSVLDRERLLKGGESGDPAIVPGDAEAGTLLAAVRWDGLEMPPKENDRLTDAQIAVIARWIEAGAPWPDEATQARYRDEANRMAVTADGVRFDTSGGTSAEWTNRRYQPDDLWAFQPVRPMTMDQQRSRLAESGLKVSDEDFTAKVVDALIQRRIDEAGLTAAPRADPRTLIRRATFDLHGLPPAPEEVETFVAASARDPRGAWEALIERLLASPRYGERWGRHWLDVTRYADTGGMSNDYERSNMWRYRDYVVRAFNSDKPYDAFVIEQLAGDELADQSVRERTSGSEA
ncbi:MAG: DUF1549 domain-containing protein, partial [Planctomycetaceae bacterium]|nr:DUF1549 domain-containing protein [Planctomycetaceae bacterium]